MLTSARGGSRIRRRLIAGLLTMGVSAMAIGAGFLVPIPDSFPQLKSDKPVGHYCLVKPGERRPHCEGNEAPADPVLAALKEMDQGGAGKMNRAEP